MRHLPLRGFFLSLFILLLAGNEHRAWAQLAPPAKEIPLYPGVAPGSENWTWTEHAAGSPGNPTIQNVVHPELMYYPADKTKAVGTAVIVAPGGGFQNLMMSYEGVDIAKRFNDMGVDAFVLKYRLKYTDPNARARAATTTAPTTTTPTGPQAGQDIRALAGADGQEAVRILRRDAAQYGFQNNRIGFIGFSAGGATAIRTVRGPADGRPDFAALVYAGDLTGDAPPTDAPRLFIAVAADDQSVGFQGSLDLFAAWRKANVPVELHIFQTGAHGFRKKAAVVITSWTAWRNG